MPRLQQHHDLPLPRLPTRTAPQSQSRCQTQPPPAMGCDQPQRRLTMPFHHLTVEECDRRIKTLLPALQVPRHRQMILARIDKWLDARNSVKPGPITPNH